MPVHLNPSHKPFLEYYEALDKFKKLGVKHEGAVRSAFQTLLDLCASMAARTLIPEYSFKNKDGRVIEPDGAVVDSENQILRYGLWEAKDAQDDLEKEIKSKFKSGYPADNILFQQPERAVLYQNGDRYFDADLTKPEELSHVLELFLNWSPPAFDEWERAVEEFGGRVRELGENLARMIQDQRDTNPAYHTAFANFLNICRTSLNPNLSEVAVEEMIVQHLLTERIFRKVFDIGDFMQRNIIAREIEIVIKALTSKAFDRDGFLRRLDHFYVALEKAAASFEDFSEKQRFLNKVYERFFQGFSVKAADVYGVVCTPPPVVRFMVNSVDHAIRKHFHRTLGSPDIHIIDPFTGTGIFLVTLMQRIPAESLPHKYREELHCNEVLLLPYYVASMNIEHAYWERTSNYEPFEGICLVDTFETAESAQGRFAFTEENTERVLRQQKAPIKVVIANPPYNANQVNANDNNKNRQYDVIDARIRETYVKSGTAKLKNKCYDPYIRSIRYASDRIGKSGIVCYINNNSFIADKIFDGVRKHLAQDFDLIYILDLGGNIRKGQIGIGNIFKIKPGVSINLFVRLGERRAGRAVKIFYHAVPPDWRREAKYEFLISSESIAGVKWKRIKPDERNNWISQGQKSDFSSFASIGNRDAKKTLSVPDVAIFHKYSLGVLTNRDTVVYGFDRDRLLRRVEDFADAYNAEVERWRRKATPPTARKELIRFVDGFVKYDRIKWSETLEWKLARQVKADVAPEFVRVAAYRPFTAKYLYYAPLFVDRLDHLDRDAKTFPRTDSANLVMVVPGPGSRTPFGAFVSDAPVSLDFAFEKVTCFPLYSYDIETGERHANITNEMVSIWEKQLQEKRLSAIDIFHYIYAVLHHPAYGEKYADDLRQELPRIPMAKTAGEFWAFAKAGGRLIDLHVNYDKQDMYPLSRQENRQVATDWRVEAMRFDKDRSSIRYNDFLTLSGVPQEAFKYRLGNRSAIEWVVDQYRVSRDDAGRIADDPNRQDDEQYILRLVGQVVQVSLETMQIVGSLPEIPSGPMPKKKS